MSLQFIESFSQYGSTSALMLNGRYAEVPQVVLVADPDPTATGFVARLNVPVENSGWLGLRRVLSGSRTRVGQAQRVWMNTLPTAANTTPYFCEFRDALNAATVRVGCTTTGQIQVDYGPTLALTALSPAPVLVANAWQHVEALVDFSATAGRIRIFVDGVETFIPALANANLNLGTECSQVSKGGRNNFGPLAPITHYKDFAVYDGLGLDNVGPIGPVFVSPITPDSDEVFGWATTGPDGFSVLDNRPPVDAQFISAGFGPYPAPAVFGLSNLPPNVASVLGIQMSTRSAKSDSGDGNLRVGLKSGGSTALGIDRPITTAFTYRDDMFEIDPATNTRWTPTSANAARLEITRTV